MERLYFQILKYNLIHQSFLSTPFYVFKSHINIFNLDIIYIPRAGNFFWCSTEKSKTGFSILESPSRFCIDVVFVNHFLEF